MDIAKKINDYISSMQTGLLILSLIGIMAAIGSMVFPDYYFQTPLFKLLLLMLFVNMISCTVNQIAKYLCRSLKGRARSRSWFRQTGVVLLHSGIVLVLAGGTLNAYYGQNAKINILEGDTVDLSSVIRIKTPFQLHLNQFKIEFNSDGSPAQYYSSVDTMEANNKAKSYTISVNHPLEYAGVKAYQESFGNLIKMEGEFGDGHNINEVFQEGDLLAVPGTDRQVKIYKYIPNFDPNYGMDSKTLRPDNPKIIFSVYENNELLGVGAASFGEPVEIDKSKYITFTGVKPFTVLHVKADPGMPLAAAGGLLLMAGVCMATIFNPPRTGKKQSVLDIESAGSFNVIENIKLTSI